MSGKLPPLRQWLRGDDGSRSLRQMGIDASRVMVVHGCTWMLLTEPHDGHIVVGLQLADSLFLLHPEDLDRMGEGFQAIAGDLARMRAGLPLDQDDA